MVFFFRSKRSICHTLSNKILLMGSDEKDGRQNGLVVGQEGRKPLSFYKSECAATYTVEGDTTPGSSFGRKILGTRWSGDNWTDSCLDNLYNPVLICMLTRNFCLKLIQNIKSIKPLWLPNCDNPTQLPAQFNPIPGWGYKKSNVNQQVMSTKK